MSEKGQESAWLPTGGKGPKQLGPEQSVNLWGEKRPGQGEGRQALSSTRGLSNRPVLSGPAQKGCRLKPSLAHGLNSWAASGSDGDFIAFNIQAATRSSQRQLSTSDSSPYASAKDAHLPISSTSVSYLFYSSCLCFSSTFCSVWVLVWLPASFSCHSSG